MKDVNPAMTTTVALQRPVADAPSFATVAERHLDDVYRYLLVLTRNPTLAEDLAAETFERAYRMLRMRHVLLRQGTAYVILPRGRELISDYANGIAHLCGEYEAQVRQRDLRQGEAR